MEKKSAPPDKILVMPMIIIKVTLNQNATTLHSPNIEFLAQQQLNIAPRQNCMRTNFFDRKTCILSSSDSVNSAQMYVHQLGPFVVPDVTIYPLCVSAAIAIISPQWLVTGGNLPTK